MSSLRIRASTLSLCLAYLLLPTRSSAQSFEPRPAESDTRYLLTSKALASALREPATGQSIPRSVPAPPPRGMTCAGCPARHVGRAFLATAGISFFYNLGNRIRGEESARISPSTWAANLKSGFEWDDDPFVTNQFGHPYQGSNYFNAGRAHGLTFWESAAVAGFGAATWELFGETNKPSMNDIINTTLGGIALGEMFYRTAWLVRDPADTGKSRMLREIGATVFDPVTSAARFISGDATRVSDKPESLIPTSLGVSGSFGALWQGSNVKEIDSTGLMFVDADLLYGDLRTGRSRLPYDAFLVHFRAGGGRAISEVRVRGRLLGQPFGNNVTHQLTIAQTYDYVSSAAYSFGAQGFEISAMSSVSPSSGLSVRFGAWGGFLALGAVDAVRPAPPEGQTTVADGLFAEAAPQDYDIGPGSSFGGAARLFVRAHQLAGVTYQGYQINAVGPGRNHVLQRVQMDLRVPIPGRLDLGTAAEFFYRKTYFPDGRSRRERLWQFRAYLAWPGR